MDEERLRILNLNKDISYQSGQNQKEKTSKDNDDFSSLGISSNSISSSYGESLK